MTILLYFHRLEHFHNAGVVHNFQRLKKTLNKPGSNRDV